MSALGAKPMSEIALSLRNISKQYGVVQALKDVSVDFRAGEIHAVVGENGSGKSTLLGVASGFVEPNRGTVMIGGKVLHRDSPAEALRLGLGIAYQDPAQVQPLSVKENLYLAAPKDRRPRSYLKVKDWAIGVLDRFGLQDIFADAPIMSLSLTDRQMLEVVKALLSDPIVLLLDEPTTALGPSGVEWLHRTILQRAAEGMAIVYVSHRLPEILSVAHRVTVLRDGTHQGTFEASGMSEAKLAELMIGRPLSTAFPPRIERSADEKPILVLNGLQGEFCGPISLRVAPGEILGIAGVEGNGQGDFFAILSGKIPPKKGIAKVADRHADLTSPLAALQSGIMLLSGDRKGESLFPVLGVRTNATIQELARFAIGGFLRGRREKNTTSQLIQDLKIRTPSMEQPVQFLSGGNQQKVVLARTRLRDSIRVILCDEPTQGVDVRSRFDIYEALHAKALEGTAILVKSSDPIELAEFCHRVVVMSRGQIIDDIPLAELSERRITEAIVGGVHLGFDASGPDQGKSIADQTAEAAGETA
ncbi:sugar ABC transporter ATP-binding protein [Anaerolineae bacterium CFX9]|jgi:ribose transport system ATP-binding protein|nr:sugar ABC transporter ATP-binding protein [Oscillatoria laete-virens]MDL1901516.1 sugar ABC transporter ATP-binding protein [Anaerolineae bacterium CFX9]MDL5055331.1 sugar ABC transporter ATP-binding protein [Oscillatoria laete-virens NRMC-F 0139]